MMWFNDGYFGHGAGWQGWVMVLLMIAFTVAIIIAIVYFARSLTQPQSGPQGYQLTPGQRETPREILQRRYAAGEIDREEYLQKLSDI